MVTYRRHKLPCIMNCILFLQCIASKAWASCIKPYHTLHHDWIPLQCTVSKVWAQCIELYFVSYFTAAVHHNWGMSAVHCILYPLSLHCIRAWANCIELYFVQISYLTAAVHCIWGMSKLYPIYLTAAAAHCIQGMSKLCSVCNVSHFSSSALYQRHEQTIKALMPGQEAHHLHTTDQTLPS